jgi:intracellular sulfur oxidation DsrE/DsrF family protein
VAKGAAAEDAAEEALDARGVQGAQDHLRGECACKCSVSYNSFTQCTGSLTRLDLRKDALDDGLNVAEGATAGDAAEEALEALEARGVQGAQDHLRGERAWKCSVSHSSFTQCTGSLTRLELGEETLEDGLKAVDRELALLKLGSSALNLALDTADDTVEGVLHTVDLAFLEVGGALELVLGTVNDTLGLVLDLVKLTLLDVYTVLATR